MSNLFDILNIPFGYVLQFCNTILPNYALALLLFALLTKILLFPLSIKQQKSQVKQAKLAPKEMAIKNKYKGRDDKPTQQKMQQEIMDLYKTEGYSPFGGCLPLVFQLPIILCLYNVIRNPLTYICHLSKDTLQGVYDKLVEIGKLVTENNTAYSFADGKRVTGELDIIPLIRENAGSLQEKLGSFSVDNLPNFYLFGNSVDLSATPTFQNWLWIIPVLTFVFSFLSGKLVKKFSYQSPSQAAAGKSVSMRIMEFAMPLFSVYIAFQLPAIIGIYWIYQSIFTVLQQMLLKKMFPPPVFTEEDYKKAEKELAGKAKERKVSSSEGKARSLHHIDDGEKYAEPEERKKKSAFEGAALKEDSDGTVPEKKTGDKPKVRSLHHIDDEEVAAERAAEAQRRIEEQKQSEKAKKEKLSN